MDETEQLLEKILMLESRKDQARIESTDANEWKKYYDAQLKVIDDYAKERAVEIKNELWDLLAEHFMVCEREKHCQCSQCKVIYDTFIKEH